MPYRRRRFYRRRRPRRNIFYRRGANKAFRLAKFVASRLNTELKVLDQAATHTPTTTGTFHLMNGMAKGTSDGQRVGQQVRFKSLQVRPRITINASATQTFIRLIVFIDRQPNAATPALDDILENTTASLNSPLEVDYFRRFSVIWDKLFTVYTDKPIIIRKFFKRRDFRTRYDASDAGTIADIATNSLYALWISSEDTNTPSISVYYRLRYIDN